MITVRFRGRSCLLISLVVISCSLLSIGFALYDRVANQCWFPGASIDFFAATSSVEITARNANRLDRILDVTGSPQTGVAISPDDNWIVVTGHAKGQASVLDDYAGGVCETAWIIDTRQWTVGEATVQVIVDPLNTVLSQRPMSIAIDPASSIAVLGNRQVIRLEDAATVSVLEPIESSYIDPIGFTPDGNLFVATDSGTIATFDGHSFQLIHSIRPVNNLYLGDLSNSVLHDGQVIVGDWAATLARLDLVSGELLQPVSVEFDAEGSPESRVRILAFVPGRNVLVYQSSMNTPVRGVLLDSGAEILTFLEDVSQIEVSPSGNLIAALFAERIDVHDLLTGDLLASIPMKRDERNPTSIMRFSPNDELLVTVKDWNDVEIYSVEGDLLMQVEFPYPLLSDVTFNQSGTWLMGVGDDVQNNRGGIRAWAIR
ncbi:MAG: WD40 repeat domain-containing protein [Anaerolineae bacterium]|nr:WD40 repeat domain-containing protein [Anaerolineae bacterium]